MSTMMKISYCYNKNFYGISKLNRFSTLKKNYNYNIDYYSNNNNNPFRLTTRHYKSLPNDNNDFIPPIRAKDIDIPLDKILFSFARFIIFHYHYNYFIIIISIITIITTGHQDQVDKM